MTKPFIMLIGHMDTVFKAGTAAERKFTIKDRKAYGPGVLDMKGGIVIALFAVQALLKSGYAGAPIKFVLAGDEEVGHVHSNTADCIMAESKGAKCTFNFETGFMDNGLVTKRKGMYHLIPS